MLQSQQHAVGPTYEVVRCPAHIPPSVACVCVAAPSEDSEVGGEGRGGRGGGGTEEWYFTTSTNVVSSSTAGAAA